MLGITLILVSIGSSISAVERLEYQPLLLDSFFDNGLFGIEFDYNPNAPEDQKILLLTDLINQTSLATATNYNNIISLVGHEDEGIKSAFLALERINRTIIDLISWQTIVPFIKYLHHFSLPSGEDVILGQDFLGIALKINDSEIYPAEYQLGYANVPLAFLELLIPDGYNSSLTSAVGTSIIIQENVNELQIDFTYSNLTFLFQGSSIDLNTLSGLSIVENVILAQFDNIKFSTFFRKYSHHEISGVETISKVSIGTIMNLIINEELPQNLNWTNAIDYEIEENFQDLEFPIHETFSWYQGSDIKQRLDLFKGISFSFITSQNVGILSDTQPKEDIQIIVDGHNRTSTELEKKDFPVTEEITLIHNMTQVFSTKVKGRNFAIQNEDVPDQTSLIPMEIQVIALNQHDGFAGNRLFIQETSLLKELVAECVKCFIPEMSALGTGEIINAAGLDLTSARYIQDLQVNNWSGLQFTINLLQFAVKTTPSTSAKSNSGKITPMPVAYSFLGVLIVCVVLKRRKARKRHYPQN